METDIAADPSDLVEKAVGGDVSAYTQLVRQHQDLAFACALAALRDFHLAQDVTQEAFVAAYFSLPKLQNRRGFAYWLRGIVRHQCSRFLRKRRLATVGFEEAAGLVADEDAPLERASNIEQQRLVVQAIKALPIEQREVLTLFYLREHSQRDVAQLLGVPQSTVNNRLHGARRTLQERMLNMVSDTIQRNALPEDFSEKVGRIIDVRGPVVDVRFAPERMPHILDSLTLSGGEKNQWFKVVQRLDEGVVRAVATQSAAPLREGMPIVNAPEIGHVKATSDADFADAVRILTGSPPEKPQFLQTGIKVIDLLCPLAAGGSVGIFSMQGVGRIVLIQELQRRLAQDPHGLSIICPSLKGDINAVQDMLTQEEGYPGDVVGSVQTFWLITERATDMNYAQTATDILDSVIYLSPVPALQGLWPAIDALHSRSRVLDAPILGSEHVEVAQRVVDIVRTARELIFDAKFFELLAYGAKQLARTRFEEFVPARLAQLSAGQRTTVERARKLERFFTQPFIVAEEFNKLEGEFVPVEDTIRTCRRMLDGEFDHISEKELLFKGRIDRK